MIAERASGILLHVTSLPSDFGIGDLGPCAYRFIDFLAKTSQRYWSILPLTPTSTQYDNSPYQPISAFAANTLLLSPEILVKDGLLIRNDVEKLKIASEMVAFEKVTINKERMVKMAYSNFSKNNKRVKVSNFDFGEFCRKNKDWLDDYSLFKALSCNIKKPWNLWSSQLRNRNEGALIRKMMEFKNLIECEKFAQFLFSRQWFLLKEYCKAKGVSIIGDLPFYMSFDSADVWAHPEIFKLNARKQAKYVGGVPPDYFSKAGQRWGNPVYNWKEQEETNFQWWISRIQHTLKLCDVLRFDHFRGFTAYWQIPASFKTAKKGRWIRAPTKNFFLTLKKFFPTLPFVAEDLGQITKGVRNNLKLLGIPGMRVLIFAFSGRDDDPNLPENHLKSSLVYTGTHDTNTVKGWFVDEATDLQKEQLFKCIGKHVLKDEISKEFINLALASKSNLSIFPMQDLLSLGSEARMNQPSGKSQNWGWRLRNEQLVPDHFEDFKEQTELTKRAS